MLEFSFKFKVIYHIEICSNKAKLMVCVWSQKTLELKDPSEYRFFF